MPNITIRAATSKDVNLVAELIRALAVYEKKEHETRINIDDLEYHLDPDSHMRIHCLLAFIDAKPVGFALYFFRYSTFLTNWGIHLEDIFVLEECRGRGIGKMLFASLASLAKTGEHERLDLMVLDWNTNTIDFYIKLGAIELTEWKSLRFTREALEKL